MLDEILKLVISSVLGGGFASLVVSVLLRSYTTRVEQRTKSRYAWKEASVSEVLGPIHMQLDRTARAIRRWRTTNLYLEAMIVRESNQRIRDILLTKPHLIPPELLESASLLVEHYDAWLERFDEVRRSKDPDLETTFIFGRDKGAPFPRDAAARFKDAFGAYWGQLYGGG